MHVTLDSDTIQWRLLLEGYAYPDTEDIDDARWVDAVLTVDTARSGGAWAEYGIDVDAVALRRFSDDLDRCVSGDATSAAIGNDVDDYSLVFEAGEHYGLEHDTWVVSGHVGWKVTSLFRFADCAVHDCQVQMFTRSLQRALRTLS